VLTLAVSFVVEFTIGAIVVSLLMSNEFVFSALIPLFLTVGFALQDSCLYSLLFRQ
jgi:hypothetical protein